MFLLATGAGAASLGLPGVRDLIGLAPGTPAPSELPSESSGPGSTSSGAGSSAVVPAPTPTPAPTPSASPRASPVSQLAAQPGLRADLQAALDRGTAALAAPGVSAAILFPDGSIWASVSGVADLATSRALDTSTPFALASISKTFLAAEMLLLADEGLVELDAPGAPMLPGIRIAEQPIDPTITVRQLLDHTSGLRDFLVDAKLDRAVRADPTAVWTTAASLAYVGKPIRAPGIGYYYANTNYVLLGLIAERITGRSLAEEYRARFFEPLALASASYQGVEPPTAQMPTAYRYTSGALDATPTDVTDGTEIRPYTSITTAAGAAGSVAASASDLVRWARALYAGQVLPAADVATMVNDAYGTARLRPGARYGLGVQISTIDGRVAYGHSGRLVGARSVVRWFPASGIAIAVLTNQSRFDPAPVLADLFLIAGPPEVVDRGWPD